MDMTNRLQLPLLAAGQLEKDLFHNEALALLDVLVAGSIADGPVAAPPSAPSVGATFLVAASGASGAFTAKENQLAAWTAAGWRFLQPVEGMRLTVQSSGVGLDYWGGAWRRGSVRAEELVIGGARVVGPAQPAIPAPQGGGTVDSEARTAIGAILDALRSHGLIQS